MAKRIKVLQLQSKYAAGVNHVADMISSALPEAQYQVVMAYLEGQPESPSENTHLFQFTKRQCGGLRRKVKVELLNYCREQQFDIVIGHRFKAISALMPVVRKLNIPKAIAVVHGIGDYDRWYRKLLANYYFSQQWQIVAVSEYVQEYLADAAKIFNTNLVSVIPNAVDIDVLQEQFLTRQEARHELSLGVGDFVFGAHGRLAGVKGFDYLLQAFAPLARKHVGAKLLLIGDGPLRLTLQQSAENLGIAKQVIFAGYRENASRYLPALDVFVMPSRSEGLSIALLEAMAAGLPVLASYIPSIEGAVADQESLLPVGDVKAWQNALEKSFSSEKVELTLAGKASSEKLVKEFNKSNFQAAYLRCLAR